MTFNRQFLLFFVFFSVFCTTIHAQSNLSGKRPKVGLVLSGGGAKGLAHIGVLKVLEEAGIPIDYITGTSMGSVVGGLYACGYKAQQIENETSGINWNELMFDHISRQNISIEEKDESEKYIVEFPLVKWKVQLPKGIADGQKISMLLARLTWPVHNISDFDKLPIPFRCVATDIVKVQPVVFKSGYLPDAIRASIAIPTFFNPIEIDGKLLVDGGIVRNFPVQDAREMGADIIIGVDVSSGLYTKEELNTAFRIFDQSSTYQITQGCEQQRALCDIYIRPEISKYDMFSFEAQDSLIALGEKAARKIFPQLQELARKLKSYNDYREPCIPEPEVFDTMHIHEIKIDGLSKVSRNLVLGNLQLPDSGTITKQDLEHGIERVYGSRFFERVNYKIEPDNNGSILTLRLKEQNHNYFKLGLNYDPNLRTSALINATYRNVLGEGSRIIFNLKLGQFPSFFAKYTIHTSLQPNIGMGVKAGFNTFQAKFYTLNKKLLANYDVYHYLAEIDFLSTLSNAFLFRTGFQAEGVEIAQNLDAYDTIRNNLKAISWYARLRFDTFNKSIFPNKGDYFNAELKYIIAASYSAPGPPNSFWRLYAYYTKCIPVFKKLAILPGINAGFNFSKNIHGAYMNYMGGSNPNEPTIFPFQGLKFMVVSTANLAMAGLKFMVVSTANLAMASLWFRFEPWKDRFLTLKTNVARTSNEWHQIAGKGTNYWGMSLCAGIPTFLGPIELSLANSALYRGPLFEIRIGYSF
jgi:NTE family protein